MRAAACAPALAIAGSRPAHAGVAAPEDPPSAHASGYRVTDHIRRYYASAQY